MVERNKLAQSQDFLFGTCTGIEGLESLLNEFSVQSNFVLSDDITTGETFQSAGAWFKRRTFTVFLFGRYDFGNEEQRQESINRCRELSRQIQSKLLHDRYHYLTMEVDFKVDNMPSTELTEFLGNGLTGLYFMVSIDEPLDLCYNEDEWE